MRDAAEIKNLVLNFAESDGRVRAVLLNGSRANANVIPDKFQDFDVLLVVNEMESFTGDHSWIDFFGKKIIRQMPEEMYLGEDFPQETRASFSYLMIFEDGNRIDLTLFPQSELPTHFKSDSLTVVWLDKDGLFANIPPASDEDYHVKKPTQKEFTDVSSEFWWICTNVAKGLLRNEIAYAKEMLEIYARPMFMRMIEWKIGIENDFSVNVGKAGKFMKRYISDELYRNILQTYANADDEENWQALFLMTEIFRRISTENARKLDFQINKFQQEKTLEYLRKKYDERKP